MEYREPCPWRVTDDCGGAFALGEIGGALFHAIKGAKNAAKGHRIVSAITETRLKAPITGGNFAMWGLMFSSFDCTFQYARGKEDPWNAIASGAATGAVLSFRGGVGQMAGSALVGGLILAMIEGVGILMTKYTAEQFNQANFAPPQAPPDPSQLQPMPS